MNFKENKIILIWLIVLSAICCFTVISNYFEKTFIVAESDGKVTIKNW